jgi:ABC-type Fe3+/spermidine/putrescine transport system ATPase subunit
MADRVAVMRAGRIVEVGLPAEIYSSPRRLFTAYFVGRTTVAVGYVSEVSGERAVVSLGFARVEGVNHGVRPGDKAVVAIKADRASLKEQPGAARIPGIVTMSLYLGSYYEVRVSPHGSDRELRFYLADAEAGSLNPGSRVVIYVPFRSVHVFPYDSEDAKSVLEEE